MYLLIINVYRCTYSIQLLLEKTIGFLDSTALSVKLINQKILNIKHDP